jgi:hypothetical protein
MVNIARFDAVRPQTDGTVPILEKIIYPFKLLVSDARWADEPVLMAQTVGMHEM